MMVAKNLARAVVLISFAFLVDPGSYLLNVLELSFQTVVNFPVLCLISIPTAKSLQPSPLLLIQGQVYPEGALMALHSGVF
jgi:hypothetical protein